MKSTLQRSNSAGANGAAAAVERLFPEFSFEKTPRQGPNWARTRAGARPGQDKAYRKALRQAEMAAWEHVPALPETGGVEPSRIPLRWQVTNRREGVVYALLTALALGTVGHQAWTAFQMAGNWANFVQFVHQLLA